MVSPAPTEFRGGWPIKKNWPMGADPILNFRVGQTQIGGLIFLAENTLLVVKISQNVRFHHKQCIFGQKNQKI